MDGPLSRDRLVGVALVLAAVAAALGPSLGDPAGAAIGLPGSDHLKHVWGQWWVWTKLTVDHAAPLTAWRIWFPDGGGFFSLDTGGVLLTAPLRLVLGPVAAFDALVVVQLVLAGLTGAALARRVGVVGPEAALAGVVFSVNAWTLSFGVASGVSEALFLWPLPLVAIGVLDTLQRPGARGPLVAAGAVALLALASPPFAVMGGVGALGAGAGWLATRPWADGRLRGGLSRAALSAGVLLGLAVPIVWLVSETTGGAQPIYPRESGPFSPLDPRALPETNAMALADLVLPGAAGLREHATSLDRLVFAAYVGFVPLALAAVGASRSVPARRALAGAAAFAALALGPLIFLDHARTWPALPNPLHLGLFHGLPYFHTTIHSTDRFMAPAMLGVGVAAASGLGALVRDRGARVGAAAAVGAVVIAVAEVLLVSPAPWPIATTPARPHPASLHLAQDPHPGAVIDIPFRSVHTGRFEGDVFLQQAFHGRPVPFRLEGRHGEIVTPVVWDDALFQRVAGPLLGLPPGRATRCEGAAELAEAGFGWFVVRRDRLPADVARAAEAPLAACLGAAIIIEDAALYRIDADLARDPGLRNPRGWRAPARSGAAHPGAP